MRKKNRAYPGPKNNLKNNKVYSAVVPDKSYFLAEKNGYLSLDYDEMFQTIQAGLPEKVNHIDLTEVLDITEYRTIPIHVQYLKGSYGTVDMGATMAIIMMAIVPIIVIYLFCQKHIIKGVAAGAVKG